MKTKRRTVVVREGSTVYTQERIGNKKDGLSVVEDNGILTGHAIYKKDILHGPSELYSDYGLVREIALFKNGKKHGPCVTLSLYKGEEVVIINRFFENEINLLKAEVGGLQPIFKTIEAKNGIIKDIFNKLVEEYNQEEEEEEQLTA